MNELTLKTNEIEATAATQVRTKMDAALIQDYTSDIEGGAIFPPLNVFAEQGSKRYILADGFHRLHAYVDLGIDEVQCDVHEGGMQQALIFALGSNDNHGLRRTRADKRNAVEMALKDPEISQMSLRQIGLICGVHHQTVGNIRDEQIMKKNKPPVVPEKNKPENTRQSRPAPTQAEVERDELRQALGLFMGLPYSGQDAAERMELEVDDIAGLNYVSDWCEEAVG